MAIKVTLGEAKPQNEKPFPKLMKNSDYKSIVLFYSSEKGVCIVQNEGSIVVGQFYEYYNMDFFTDYNEPITIQNA